MAGLATENEDLSTNDEDILGTVEVQPEPPPADDDDDDDEGSAPEAGRPPRKERRAARAAAHRELQENQRRLEQQLNDERVARARMEAMLEQNLRQQPQGPHPLEVERDRVMRQQEEHFNNFANNVAKMSPEERNQATQRARELEQEKHDVMFRLAALRSGMGQQQNPQMAQQQALRAALDARYPDIAANQKAAMLGRSIWQQLLIEGKPDNWDTADEAAELTRQRLKMQSRATAPRPTEQQKSKFVAAPKGPAGGGGGAESGPIRISKAQATMAENAYPNLPAAKAHQKWWNLHGKKHA